MKKQWRIGLLALCVACICAGCENHPEYSTESKYVPGQDYQYTSSITETDDAYYYPQMVLNPEDGLPDGAILMYIDKETMEPIPLCSRPDCNHGEETEMEKIEACSAYLPTSTAPYYDGSNLYFERPKERSDDQQGNASVESGFELVKMDLDGTQQQVLSSQSGSISFPLMHRGYFYCLLDFYTADGKEEQSGVYRIALQKDAKPELLYQAEEPMTIYKLDVYGNGLYISENFMPSPDTYQCRCVRLDLLIKETQEVFHNDSGLVQYILEGFCNEKLMYCIVDLETETGETALYLAGLDGSNPTEVKGAGDFSSYLSDGEYIYRIPITWNPNYSPKDPFISVLDTDGKKILSLSQEETEETVELLPGNGPYLFRMAQIEGENKLLCAKKSDISTGKLHWEAIA